MPEVSGPRYGCFAKVPRYSPDNSKENFRSIYQDSYLSRFQHSKFKSITGEILTNNGVYSGMKSDFLPLNKKHISSKLINERYNNSNEAKSNTEIQRSWTYHSDPAINAITKLNIDNASNIPIPQEVEFMSLPMFNHEERRKMIYYNNVNCGHKLSDITKRKLKEMAKARKDREEALKEKMKEKMEEKMKEKEKEKEMKKEKKKEKPKEKEIEKEKEKIPVII